VVALQPIKLLAVTYLQVTLFEILGSRYGEWAMIWNDDGSLDSLTGAIVFKTERLACRRWLPSDIDTIFRVYSDPDGCRWVGDGTPITYSQCKRWLQVTANNYALRGYGMFALDDLRSDETLGFCGLVHPSDQADVEIKYAFLRSHWGRGYASEVVPHLLAHGVRSHRLEKIIATVDPENIVSQRILLKSGFAFEKAMHDEIGPFQVFVWHPIGEPTHPDRSR
jgi:RimJ/RimL family protein N-acetyltransferase